MYFTSLHTWLEDVERGLPGSVMEKGKSLSCIAFSCWAIWKSICDGVFNCMHPSPSRTLLAINSTSTNFLEVLSEVQTRRIPPGAQSQGWDPPPYGVIKVNVDATWKQVAKHCHVGVVIRDSSSCCLAVRRRRVRASSVLRRRRGGVGGVYHGSTAGFLPHYG